MRRKFERVWVSKEFKMGLKRIALEKDKNLVDLTPEDINRNKKKKDVFSFRI